MPLPNDEVLVAKAQEVIGLLKGAFGTPPGYRPAHAKGIVLHGKWTPSAEAKSLSKALHFSESTTVTARFSDSTGIPAIPDNDSNASPRGFAVRFNYPPVDGRRKHTDIVGHSTPHFPARTGAEFGEFLQAFGASQAPGIPHPTPIEQFLGSHPHTLEFVTAPKPFPVSFGTEGFFALNAFKLISADGKETYVRYEFVPEAGLSHLSDEEAKAKGPSYLSEELKERISKGPIGIKLLAQVAEAGDKTDDITVHWPADRKKVELGTIKLESLAEHSDAEQKATIFDPIPRVDGIEPSDDPILEFRAALYLISGRERRSA